VMRVREGVWLMEGVRWRGEGVFDEVVVVECAGNWGSGEAKGGQGFSEGEDAFCVVYPRN